MADKKYDMEFSIPGKKKTAKRFPRIFLIASASVLVAALAISAVLLSGSASASARILDFGTVINGVSIDGIDISGMTPQQAREALSGQESALLAKAQFKLDVNGEMYDFNAQDFSVTTDFEDVFTQAMNFGHTGTFDKRTADIEKADKEGMNYPLSLKVDEQVLAVKLADIKLSLDKEPQDAGFEFMPWGYSLNADGTAAAYTPDTDALIKDSATTKAVALTYPENLVRLTAEEMPPEIRYQYYKNTKYTDEVYLPDAAYISRFYYTQEVTGLIADTAAISDEIISQIKSEEFSTITVPVQITEPTVKLDQIKQQTHLITSWTSSYSTHYYYERNWNVAKMSGIISGQILQPGVQWSINDTAGPRYLNNGWKAASGIVDGGYVDQPGGGVCQISSTLYNAAIRCGLTSDNIVSKHHSIISGYIPLGLDATISTGGPDLKITNPYSTPLYIVSFMNPETKSVTVQIYGAPVIDTVTGEEVIYNFDSKSRGSYGEEPIDIYYFDKFTLPDGTAIPVGESKRYASKQSGKRIQSYRHFLKLDGTEYNSEDYESVTIRPINGSIYCNYSDPALTPTETQSESPSASPTTT